MQRLTIISFLALCLSFNVIPSRAVNSDSNKVSLTTFQIELRSTEMSKSEELASLDLKNLTEKHITYFIQQNSDSIWNGFESISLNAQEEDIHIFRRLNIRRNNSRAIQSIATFEVKYSGSLTFSGESYPLPTTEQVEKIVVEAFIGQGKLDYLRLLRGSTDNFLSSSNYAKVWIPDTEEDNPKVASGGKRSFLIVSIIASVIILMSVVLMSYFICCYKRSQQNPSVPASLRNATDNESRKQKHVSKDDIKLAPTRSMSPSPEPAVLKPKYSKRHTHLADYHHVNNVDVSMVSKDTIDINSSFDMIAWKNTCLDSKTPFETDLTMITNTSPNKTVRVEVPREIGGRRKAFSSKPSSRLSHGMLSQHNQRYGHQSSIHRSRSKR